MSSSSKSGKSRKQKKVQTRIAFAPADSPPAAEKASVSPARVVYESPKKSSFTATSSSSRSSRRAGFAPRISQAPLSFSTVSHNDGDSNIDDDGIPEGKKFAVVIRSSSAKVSSPAKSRSPNTSDKKRRKTASFMPKASKSKSKSKLQNTISVDSSEDDEVESEDEAEEPLKKIPKPAARANPVEDEDEDEDEEPVQQTPRLAGRRKPSYLSDSDEEPLTKPPKAIVRADGRVVIIGEKTPSPSPPPEDFQPKKTVNSRSFIAGGQLGQARYKGDYKPVVVRGARSNSPGKDTKKKDVIVLPSDDSSDDEAAKAPTSSRGKAIPHKNDEAAKDPYDSEPAGYMLEHQAERAGAKHKVFGTKATKDVGPSGTPHPTADDDDEDVSIVRSSIKRLQKSAKKDRKPEPPGESDSEEEEKLMPTPAKKRRLSPPAITDDDEDDDLPIIPAPATAKKGSKRARSSSADSDLPAVVPTPGNKRRRLSYPNSDNDQPIVDLDSDIDNDSLFASSKASPKKKAMPAAPLMVKATERARIKDKGKAEAKAKADKETITARVRSSQPKRHRSDKEKAMELMRRKRNGEKITQLTDSEFSDEDDKRKMGMYDTDSEAEVLSQFDDEEEEEDNQEKIRKSLLPQNRNKNKEDDDEDDFVVEDDDEPLGVPGGLHDIPIEFTNQAHKKLSEHFKDAVEWMVQRRLNPGFQRDDPVYLTAFRKLEDDPKGLVSSKLVSTVWSPKFTRALYARPDYNEVEIGASGEGKKCAACNRGKHPVSWMVTLGGKPYDEKTLEEIDQSDNEDEDSRDSDSSKASKSSHTIDAKGNRLPPAKKQWFLGSTCKANASAAHGLIHWKHFLDQWVLDALQLEGWFTPEKLAERAMWKKKKLDQLSMDVVDEWTETKQLKTLFREFQGRIEGARNLENQRYGNR